MINKVKNILNILFEDKENTGLLISSITLISLCTFFNLYGLGFALMSAGLVTKSIWEIFKTNEIKKGVHNLILQQLDLLKRLEESKLTVDNKQQNRTFKNRRKNKKVNNNESN